MSLSTPKNTEQIVEPTTACTQSKVWVRESAEKNRNLLFGTSVFFLYLILSVLQTTDLDLLLGKSVKLPVVNVYLPLFTFYITAPLLVFFAHLNLLRNIEAHSKKLAQWHQLKKDDGIKPEELFPFIFDSAVFDKQSTLAWLTRLLNNIAFYWLGAFAVLIIFWRFTDYQSILTTFFHAFLVVADLWVVRLVRSHIYALLTPIHTDKNTITDTKNTKSHQVAKLHRPYYDFKIFWLLGAWACAKTGQREKINQILACLFAFSLQSILVVFVVVMFFLNSCQTYPYSKVYIPHKSPYNSLHTWVKPAIVIDRKHNLLALDESALRLQKEMSEDSTGTFHEWFLKHGKGLDLRNRSLRLANLENADFRVALLQHVDFQDAYLVNAQFQGATLWRAQFQGAYLEKAQFQGAYLEEAQLQGVNLYEAQFQGAALGEVQFQGANLRRAQFQGASLREVQLQGANLYEAKLQGVYLANARLQGANLRDAQLQGANLGGVQFQGAYLGGAWLQGASLRKVQLQGTNLRGAQLQGVDLRRAQLQGANLGGVQLQGANLGGAQLQGANLRRARLQGANLWEAQLQGVDLYKAQVQGSTIYETAIWGVNLNEVTGLSDVLVAKSPAWSSKKPSEVDWQRWQAISDDVYSQVAWPRRNPMSDNRDYIKRLPEAQARINGAKALPLTPLSASEMRLKTVLAETLCAIKKEKSRQAARKGMLSNYKIYDRSKYDAETKETMKAIRNFLNTPPDCPEKK